MNGDLKKRIRQEQFNLRGIFVSTYIPRHCGIATYTKDLTNAINILSPRYLSEIMALDDPHEPVDYPWEVKLRIPKERERSYLSAADYINNSSADYVCLQHEFGIFGGRSGEYVLNLVRNIRKPLVVSFHTTLKDPTPEQAYIVRKIADRAKACVVMIPEAAKRLKKVYGISSDKIIVIPHGVPNIPFSPSHLFKEQVGFSSDDFLIGSINLIAPNKGLEYVIEAMPKILKVQPKAKFVMIGQTHPLVKIRNDETYRKRLVALVKKHRLEKSFVEINEYVALETLVDYLKALDIYITPYLDMNQTSSGTLAYAIGAGKVCISTPYIYAKEILAHGRGLFVKPKSSAQIASAITQIVKDEKLRGKIETKAYEFGRVMIWERVALDYLNLFREVVKKS